MKKKEVIKLNKCFLLKNLLRNRKIPFNENNCSLSIKGLIKAGIIIPIYKRHKYSYLMISNNGFNFLKNIFKPFSYDNKKINFRKIKEWFVAHTIYYVLAIVSFLLTLLSYELLIQIVQINGVTDLAVFLSFSYLIFGYVATAIPAELLMYALLSIIGYYIRQPVITETYFRYCVNQNHNIKWNNDLKDLFKIRGVRECKDK